MKKFAGPHIIDISLNAYCLTLIAEARRRGDMGKALQSVKALRAARLRGVVERFPV